MSSNPIDRRRMLKVSAAGMLTLSAGFTLPACHDVEPVRGKQGYRHAVCRWTYGFLSLEQLCKVAREAGIHAIDLVGPDEWQVVKDNGLEVSMCNGAEISLTEGWNDTQYHETLVSNYTALINQVAEAGYKNIICFSGNRGSISDEEGLEACVSGLNQIIDLAEEKGVVLQMELFNSKVDHPDYMCDNTAWGIELCKRLGSESFKLLYDIYHMQIQEGDIIRTIQDNHRLFGHYHTAGVPGRHEIEDEQELNYKAIMKAIDATGFEGYVAQEFIPSAEDEAKRIKALHRAIDICTL